MRAIDLHAHLTPRCIVDARAAGRTLHGIEAAALERGRQVAPTTEERITQMDALGVDVQVVSTVCQMYAYEHPAAAALAIHRECNDEIHRLTKEHPDRFAGLAIVPMQEVDAAVEELHRAIEVLGLLGIMIGDHVNGTTLDDQRFRPLWAAAEQLGALVFVHQAGATITSNRIDRYHLSNTVGNLAERMLTFSALVLGGVMDEFPTLEVCLAHGGGYTCFGAARLDWGWAWHEKARGRAAAPPSTYLRRFSYDSITHDEAALRFLVDKVGADRVLFGTDYPGFATGHAHADYQPVDWLRNLTSLTPSEKENVLHRNATRLLHLESR
jgi:aminocarboxymuconate-semialdehyde decarboxylase